MKPEELLEVFQGHGGSFLTGDGFYQLCRRRFRALSFRDFSEMKEALIEQGTLRREEGRLYLPQILEYEKQTASALAERLSGGPLPHIELPRPLYSGDIWLSEEQREAVGMALSRRISVILGGAGSGKTTLIRAIAERFRGKGRALLCAPTGKAARNLTEQSGMEAQTIHLAFGAAYRERKKRPDLGLVIVDEAGAVSLECFCWILWAVGPGCRIVLVGDPNQLPAVGCGNVLPDLLKLGVPSARLRACYRQTDRSSALAYNVRSFEKIRCAGDLRLDGSFLLIPVQGEAEIQRRVCELGTRLYRSGEDAQILSPYKERGLLSAAGMNRAMQAALLSSGEGKEKAPFAEGERIVAVKNCWKKGVLNGDTGTFFTEEGGEKPRYGIRCQGRQAVWEPEEALDRLEPAYAVTIHKAQGSAYDTVLLPVSGRFAPMLNRNLLYTAISRARKRAVLIGDPAALDGALSREPQKRASSLVERVRRMMRKAA